MMFGKRFIRKRQKVFSFISREANSHWHNKLEQNIFCLACSEGEGNCSKSVNLLFGLKPGESTKKRLEAF